MSNRHVIDSTEFDVAYIGGGIAGKVGAWLDERSGKFSERARINVTITVYEDRNEAFWHGLGTLSAPEKAEGSEPCGPEPDADERT